MGDQMAGTEHGGTVVYVGELCDAGLCDTEPTSPRHHRLKVVQHQRLVTAFQCVDQVP